MNKKLLVLVGAAVFLAAGCNSQTPRATNTTTTSTSQNASSATAGIKVDAAVDALNKSMDTESSMNMQSDSDIVNNDEEIINSYNGASNANSY